MARSDFTIKEFMRQAHKADLRFQRERDRRYTELNTEREKALKIKQSADQTALSLAREIQAYRDEKANNLREQIGAERGTYATKSDLTSAVREIQAMIAPLKDYVAISQGTGLGKNQLWSYTVAGVGVLAIIWGIWHTQPVPPPPPTPGTVGAVPLPGK